MAPQKADYTCAIVCWGVGILLGVLTTAGLMVVGWTFLQGAFMGILAWLVVGGFLSFAVCTTPKPAATPAEASAKLQADLAAAQARVQGGAPAPSKPAPAAPAPEPAPAPAAKAAPAPAPAAEAASKVKPSPALAGEAELAARKGDWKYDNGFEPAAAPAAAPAVPEGKPAGLDAPHGGAADDLKKIKGVGPKLEKLLNSHGFFHFGQIANWSASDVAWVDENLVGFKGRATRDEWVDQAKKLAAGEETAFSKRVEDGDVY
ncbi:MAG: endonuclease [Dinoroseobacter sp.]|nr:endonuclease [Dinoroseobacter sp.]